MYRTPTHEPRYKQRTHDRESRCKARRYEERRVSSEASSSEEDEESTDRYTEESEDTTESQHDRGDCEWDAAGSSLNRGTRPEDFLMRAYYADGRVQKHDKITQKNFLSPFPSFLIPPIYRGGAPLQNYRYPMPGNPGEDDDATNSGKPPRGSPKKSDNYEEENTCARFTTRDQKLCDKHKAQREMKCMTRSLRPQRVLTCTQGKTSLDPSSMQSRNAFAGEPSSRNSPKMEAGRKPKGGFRESKPEEISPGCKDCLQCMENRKRGRRSTTVGAIQIEKAAKEPLSGGTSPRGALGSIGSGKVREKLVYVVEEEGKDMTKLETDLFSVNEILTIKKDLLELSEFAKKLKKLKKMKKDVEKGKAGKSECQCQPVAELLKNVNKRIEALEARQEELERGSHKTSQKGDTETESKKTTDQKTLSDSPPKTPVVRKQSAMMSVPSFPKPEMVISRAGFSNNSEIVNELMDIKTQLHKLEKRRMSRELTPEAAPLGESNRTKKKDHAIAVFSSRTYILTSENYEKTKTQQSVNAEGQGKSYIPVSDNPRSRTEQTKENVANWLKNVSPIRERSENEVAVFLEAEKPEPEINAAQPGSIGCTDFFNGFESQEPPKNRASEAKSAMPARASLDPPTKNVSKTRVSKRETPLICKECIMTPDGRLFVKKSGNDFASGRISSSKGVKEVVVRRSASSCSAASPILTKERLGRMKKVFRDFPTLLVSHSKSTHELSGNSSGRKDQKTGRNLKVKDHATPPREKIHKESTNELVKKRESNVDVMKDFGRGDDPLSSSTFSELIRTINLEKPSDSIDGQDSYRNNMHIYSLATMARLNLKGFDLKYKDDAAIARERAKERRRREEAEREAARKEIPRPGYSRRNEPSPIQVVNLCEKEKVEKVEQEVCECICCCKKKLKVCSDERKDSGNETCSTVDSRVHRSRSRERGRRRKRCSSERVMFKKSRDREKRRRERRKDRLCRMISREFEKRRRSKESKECKRRSSEIVCVRKCKSRERPKKKKCAESPKRRTSRRGIFCRHVQPSCNCQAPPETSSCETESLRSRDYSREGNRSSECLKTTVPMRPQPPSKDSVEIYLKRQRRKAEIEKEKLADDNCPFRNVLKNLRKFYPKLSNFQLGNYPGEFSDVKASQQQQPPQTCSDGDNTPKGCIERSVCQSRSPELKDRGHNHRHFRHHNIPSPDQCYDDPWRPQTTKPEHLKNCKCVRVYLQTQGCQAWPGVMPHPKLSDKSENEMSSANSTESRKLIKSDFIFPGRLPQHQCVAHCCEKKPKCRKHPHRRHKRKSTHCRCRRRKHHRKKNRCMCDRCGNVHRRKKHKKCVEKCDCDVPRKCDCDVPQKCDCDVPQKCDCDVPQKCDCDVPQKCDCEHKTFPIKHHPPQLHLPMFSFLRYFCKSKTHPSKTCHTTPTVCHKKKKPPKEHHRKTHPQKTDPCCFNICDIEERLEHLEQAQLHKKDVDCIDGKKEHKKKKHNQCDCCETSGTDSQGCSECRTKKKKKKCSCCPNSCENEVQTYYFTNPVSDKVVETNESLTTKTTTTTTATTATTEDTETSAPSKSLDNPSKGHCKLRGRLSSLQSLLNSFHRCKKSKPQTNNNANVFVVKETDLVEDRSPMPRGRIVPELKAEPSGFLEKIRKLKGKKSKKQNGDEEEKVKVEEKPHHKSRGRRHW